MGVKVNLAEFDAGNLFGADSPEFLSRLQALSRENLEIYVRGLEDVIGQIMRDNNILKRRLDEMNDRSILLGDQFAVLRHRLFDKSSERMAAPETSVGGDLVPGEGAQNTGARSKKARRRRVRLPSERYPEAPLIERDITLEEAPSCRCCSKPLVDSGMSEDREMITKIPAQFYVVREKRHKYRCTHCHGNIVTAPSTPQIKPGSAFSDEFVIDVAASKFCDLIPIDRQVRMAERLGFPGLPPQSLIETTHYLREFLSPVYEELKRETFASRVLNADETPHRMLEGDKTSSWYFWGFSGPGSAYFEAHSTRSGEVAASLIKDSAVEVLMSDVFSGYRRATRDANEFRATSGRPLIKTGYCNAHARRKFREGESFPAERDYFLRQYQRIYHLESQARDPDKPPEGLGERLRESREQMRAIFHEMRVQAVAWITEFSAKSSIVVAMNYFLKNYDGLTLFTEPGQLDVPIDNNVQERLLRNPVIGRKTWYGTHSKQGAKTTAVLFSIIESCKLNRVNPRDYLRAVVAHIHAGKPAFTPRQFALN